MGLNRVELEDPSVFRDLAHRYSEQYLDKTSIAVLERERPAITGHLELAQPPLGHGMALFASTPAGLMSSWVPPEDQEADLWIRSRFTPRQLVRMP